MCFSVYISTTSAEDLTAFNGGGLSFEPLKPESLSDAAILSYPHKWFLSTHGGCSCHFRHLGSWGQFTEPMDWWSEEQDDIDRTALLYDVLRHLVNSGEKLDLVDRWEGTPDKELEKLDVSLGSVSRPQFLLMDDRIYEITA